MDISIRQGKRQGSNPVSGYINGAKTAANRVFKGPDNIGSDQNHLLKAVSFISEPKSEFGVAVLFLIFREVLLFEIVLRKWPIRIIVRCF